MRTLELFSGTQSFSKGVKRYDLQADVITVDLLPKFSPTHCVNIMDWDYKQYPVGYFSIIWASPPCTEYSKAKTRGIRDLEGADALVRKAFEIIDYFQPKWWVIENVATGLLPKRMPSIRSGLSSYEADYCCYGKPYRKRTIFWSNCAFVLEKCRGKEKCPQMKDGRHIGSVGNGRRTYNEAKINSVWMKNSIPEALIDTMIRSFVYSYHQRQTFAHHEQMPQPQSQQRHPYHP